MSEGSIENLERFGNECSIIVLVEYLHLDFRQEYQLTSLGMVFRVQDVDYLKTCEKIWTSMRKVFDNDCEGKILRTVTRLVMTLLNGVRLVDAHNEVFYSVRDHRVVDFCSICSQSLLF